MNLTDVYLSREEYALYNPAFLSTLCRRAVDGTFSEYGFGLSIPLAYIAVGLSLTPRILSEGKPTMRSHLSAWIDQDAGRIFEIHECLPALTKPVAAGIRFGMAFDLLSVADSSLVQGRRPLKPMTSARSKTTYDAERMAYFYGRWLPKAGSAESVLSTLRLQV